MKKKSCLLFLILIIAACTSSNDENKNTQISHNAIHADKKFENNGLKIIFPPYWRISKSNDSLYIVTDRCQQEKFCQNFVIRFSKNTEYKYSEDIANEFCNALKYKFNEFKIVDNQKKIINNYTVSIVDYMFIERGLNLGSSVVFIIKNKTIITIYFTALNEPEGSYVNYRDKFKSIINTIVIN